MKNPTQGFWVGFLYIIFAIFVLILLVDLFLVQFHLMNLVAVL